LLDDILKTITEHRQAILRDIKNSPQPTAIEERTREDYWKEQDLEIIPWERYYADRDNPGYEPMYIKHLPDGSELIYPGWEGDPFD
jgi:hypothetical protein